MDILQSDQVPVPDSELQKLSESCPLFIEEDGDWFDPKWDQNINIVFEEIVSQYWEGKYGIDWKGIKKPMGLGSINFDEESTDNKQTRRVKDVMRYLQKIQNRMRTNLSLIHI